MKLSSDANHKVRGNALYLQEQLSLGDWHLVGGLRLEMYNTRSKDPLDPTKVILTGLQRTDGIELSARAELTEEIYLRGGIAFRMSSRLRQMQICKASGPATSRANMASSTSDIKVVSRAGSVKPA